MNELCVIDIDEVDFGFAPRRWNFAEERRAEIATHFEERRRKATGLWNGRVLLLSDRALRERRLSGTFFETDFASFLAWRDWNCPDQTVTNCFAMGALRASDGAFLVGVMGAHTANAGRVYFPAGTPEPEDIRGGIVDLQSNVVREVAEETGLTPDNFAVLAGWHAVLMGPRIALFKLLQAKVPAVDLRARILAFLASENEPEFSDIRIVRGPGDLDSMMPPFVVAFLKYAWNNNNGERASPRPESGER
jgi:8-oxo-dGTP pyrophosphatase MutT (NUDIX family)